MQVSVIDLMEQHKTPRRAPITSQRTVYSPVVLLTGITSTSQQTGKNKAKRKHEHVQTEFFNTARGPLFFG